MYRPIKPCSQEEQFFERKDFTYEAGHERFQCPAGKWLTLKQHNKGDRIYQAEIDDCANYA